MILLKSLQDPLWRSSYVTASPPNTTDSNFTVICDVRLPRSNLFMFWDMVGFSDKWISRSAKDPLCDGTGDHELPYGL